MLNYDPYYFSVTRKCLVSFGALFKDIRIERADTNGVVQKVIEVPVSYGNKEKWLARIKEDPNLDKRVLITLPRIGFELVNFTYDSSRKLNKMTQITADAPDVMGAIDTMYTPVPWNLGFNVYIHTKTQDDALRIVEQILPFFCPSYTVVINMIPEMNVKQNVPVVLTSCSVADSFEGSFDDRREIVYTLTFDMKTMLFGPKTTSNVILHTRTQLGVEPNQFIRENDIDVVGDLQNYHIVDKWFDIPGL